MKIIVTKRANDYHAYVGNEGVWGCGGTLYEAIGNLVANHPEKFDLEIEVNGHVLQG